MFGLNTDLAPLIDHVDAATCEKIGNGSVGELDLEIRDTGFRQQPRAPPREKPQCS